MKSNDYHKIAAGNNNEAGLVAWHRLSADLFTHYVHPNSEWERRPRDLTADQVYKTRGKDKLTLKFIFWTPQEMDYFISTFFANDEEDVKVTVRAPKKDSQAWANFNADMERPRFGTTMRDQDDNFYDVQIIYRNLTELP